jgi:hypothetical protein
MHPLSVLNEKDIVTSFKNDSCNILADGSHVIVSVILLCSYVYLLYYKTCLVYRFDSPCLGSTLLHTTYNYIDTTIRLVY